MDVTSRRAQKEKKLNPYNKREAKIEKGATKVGEKAVKPVAKDTNKTRRKNPRPGVLIKTHK